MSKILDSLFARWKRPEKEAIAAPERWGARSFAGQGSAVAGAITPERLLGILQQADNGDMLAQSELFTTMEERDGELMGLIGQRKAGVLSCKSEILAGDEDDPRSVKAKEMVEQIRTDLDEIQDGDNLQDNELDLLDAIPKAFSCLEVIWDTSESQWWPRRLEFRPQAWWTVDETDHNKLLLRDSRSFKGVEVNPLNFLIHRHRATSGCLTRTALSRSVARPFVVRNYALKDWLVCGDLYGVPTRLGELPQGAGKAEQALMLEALQNLGSDAYGVVPFGGKITFADVAKMGSAEFFAMLIEAMGRWYQIAILGQRATSGGEGAGGLNSGTSDVQQNVRYDILDSDARRVDRRWSGFYATVTRLNFGPDVAPPLHHTIVAEPKDLAGLSQVTTSLVNIGLPVSQAWAHDTFGIPAPQTDEQTGQIEPLLKPGVAQPLGGTPPMPPAVASGFPNTLENALSAGQKKNSLSDPERRRRERMLASLR